MERRRPFRDAAGMEIPREMLQEILVKLPTRDVARLCCVSKLWGSVVNDTSFRDLHAATYIAPSSDGELLLVSHRRVHGWTDEASVFNVSSGKPMCHVTIPRGYSLASICNGFLCFVHGHEAEAPAVVCNPVTGEKLTLPMGPPSPVYDEPPLFAMGFSPSTNEYKLFRFSFGPNDGYHDNIVYLHVHTLGRGGGGGWRQHSYLSEPRPIRYHPPLFINSKLYVVNSGSTQRGDNRVADTMMVLDVASERRHMYRLPYPINQYPTRWDPVVDTFEMNGQVCLAVNIFHDPSHQIQFWVMSPPHDDQRFDGKDGEDNNLYWDLRYSFDVDDIYILDQMTAAWIDNGGMLCYRIGDTLYQYDTRRHSVSRRPICDQQLGLPWTTRRSFKSQQDFKSYQPFWNIYSGYRPTLLSPMALSLPPPQEAYDEDQGHKLEKHVLCVVRCSR